MTRVDTIPGPTCARLLARRRGLRPDLPCGLPAKHMRDGAPVCGRCAFILDRRKENPMSDPRKRLVREIMAQAPGRSSYAAILKLWDKHQPEIDAAHAATPDVTRSEHARRILVAILMRGGAR